MHKRLIDKFKSKAYRSNFVSAQVRRTIAAQIKALREHEKRKWTQAELGQYAGMKPNAISRLENPNYGDFTINTLLRLAEAFDVGLIVRFAPFSEVVAWNQGISPSSFVPSSFGEDRALAPKKSFSQLFYRPQQLPNPGNLDFFHADSGKIDYRPSASQASWNIPNLIQQERLDARIH